MTTSKSHPILIGAVRGLIITDGSETSPLEDALRKFPHHAEQIRAAATAPTITMCRNVLFLETAGRRILIDGGQGNLDPDDPGMLLPTLRAANLAPESIDTIVISHFHGDHIGGLTDDAGKPTFPKAKLIASQAEHDFWFIPDFIAAMPEERSTLLRRTFAAYPPIDLIAGEAEIAPGVRLLPAYGHTPGHLAVLVESDGQRLLAVVDAWHILPQINVPEARIKYDLQPELAISTRRALLDRVEAEGLLTLVYHFEQPGLGYIRRAGDRRVWVSVSVSENGSAAP
jgi:glyoxylase-like metal-dependent hydrolase (beta-lactamase superfamily II)